MKKYKALMLDVDGTTIPNRMDGMPSKNVRNAIKKAKKILHVSLVTARPHLWAVHIVESLKLTSPYIADGGAQIIDPKTDKILWEQTINKDDIGKIVDIANKYKCQVTYSDGNSHELNDPKKLPEKIFNIFFAQLSKFQSKKLIEEFNQIPTISSHQIPSWSSGTPAIIVNHAEATKQHGIFEVAKILGIETHEIIGVGDGYNDFPLLMACGLKVAMGNAVPELKEIADYIAPSVDEDGVADVIEKFILKD